MVQFNLWLETFIFGGIFSVIILVPCFLVAVMGKKMIEELGQYPSRTPFIQMSIFFKLVVLEIFTFGALFTFYHVLAEYQKGA